jgi:hypothetical protein
MKRKHRSNNSLTGIGRPVDIEAMSVVSSNDDQSLVQLPNLLEVLQRSPESVIKLQKIAQSSVNVLNVHLFVDQSGLGHEHESGVSLLSSGVEDVNSFKGHLLESRLVITIVSLASPQYYITHAPCSPRGWTANLRVSVNTFWSSQVEMLPWVKIPKARWALSKACSSVLVCPTW